MENTNRPFEETAALARRARKLYFVGICGVSMAGLAAMAKARGWQVAGCDRDYTGATAHTLFRLGIRVSPEGDPHPEGAEAIVYTTAIREDSPAVRYAREGGLPLLSRADFLAVLMSDARVRIAVAGMHGKSTTVGMLAAILAEAGLDPTVSCGAPLTPGGSAYRIGAGSVFLAEACEYRDAFLALSPTLAVVTNIDLDHPDWFRDLGAVKSSFLAFFARAERSVIGADCAALRDIAPVAAVGFGYGASADYRGADTPEGLSVFRGTQSLGTIPLAVPGRYNRENALAATAAAAELGIPFPAIRDALAAFRGVGRRMETVGRMQGAIVALDYAHHPTEIAATLSAAAERAAAGGGRVLCLFQPHTYTRTAALWEDFAAALGLADKTLLLDIYAAREEPLPGITSAALAAVCGADYAPDFGAAVEWTVSHARAGDLLLIMGAGDIDRLVRYLPLDPVAGE